MKAVLLAWNAGQGQRLALAGRTAYHQETAIAHVILSERQIHDELDALPGWSYRAPNIEAEYKFANFRDAIAFIVQVAIQAEVMDHHPEFHNSWNKVSFSFCTHDVGNKITDTDIKLAKHIDETAKRFLSLKTA